MTLETLLAGQITLKAASITLRADTVHFEVVARAFIHADTIKEQGQFGARASITLQALRGLAGGTLPARPVTVSGDGEPVIELIDQVAVFGHCQSSERLCRSGHIPVDQTLDLDHKGGASTKHTMWVDIFHHKGVSGSIKRAREFTKW